MGTDERPDHFVTALVGVALVPLAVVMIIAIHRSSEHMWEAVGFFCFFLTVFVLNLKRKRDGR